MLLSHYTPDLIECGCDEAGRGCLAGAVFAAAVILPKDYQNKTLNDSKQLSEKQRYLLRDQIEKDAVAWAVSSVSPQEIDQTNILRAAIHAMNLAVAQLTVAPQLLLIDGNRFYNESLIPYCTIVKGDGKDLPRRLHERPCTPVSAIRLGQEQRLPHGSTLLCTETPRRHTPAQNLLQTKNQQLTTQNGTGRQNTHPAYR